MYIWEKGQIKMLEVNNLKAGYGEIDIIHDVSMKIESNNIVALIGANGAGKSTLIKAITRMIPISNGEIIFEANCINNIPIHKIIDLGISLVPEGRRLFPYMTVRENLDVGGYSIKEKKEFKKNIDWVFSLFPKLKERQFQLAGTFSGGEQQMLTIARALMTRPKFLILDEPSLGLAPVVVQSVFETVRMLNEEGVTILLVEQNVQKSLEITNWGYVLENGRISMSDESRELINNENIKSAYLGM